jgi:hypothetical protein
MIASKVRSGGKDCKESEGTRGDEDEMMSDHPEGGCWWQPGLYCLV